MSLPKKLTVAFCSAVLASSLVVLLPASPAFAATCSARVNFGTSGGTGSATEFNGQSIGAACALVQVHVRGWWDSTIHSDYYGPQSSASSYASGGGNSFSWFGKAKPSTIWSEKQWTSGQNNVWKSFTG